MPVLRKLRPEWEIVYFGAPESIRREGLKEKWNPLGIEVHIMTSLKLSNIKAFNLADTGKFIGYLQQRYSNILSFLPLYFSGSVHREIEKKTRRFDLVFFPWLYRFQCPDLACPMVGIMHDFNYKYHFCAKGFHPWTREYLEKTIPIWLDHITPIVSTHFMKREMAKFHPRVAHKTEVVHLAPLSPPSHMKDETAAKIVRSFGITKRYILCPSSTAGPHKNLGSLLSAMSLLRKDGHDIILVLTGFETAHIQGRSCKEGVELGAQSPDVLGLGYVSNEQMDALIQCAAAVVNPSLYEAGNGPGLDAWIRGVPVAMSDIDAFQEHISMQGVCATIFDPRSPKDIAEKIGSILLNPMKAKEEALLSQKALEKFSWEETVFQYIKVFENALNRKSYV